MKNKSMLIAATVGVFTSLLAFYLLYSKAKTIEDKSAPIPVLTAAHYIPAGSYLTSDMVQPKSVPGEYLQPGSIHDLHEVEGLTTLVPISAGEQILDNKFGSGGESLSFSLNNGYRAYTVEVNEVSGVSDLLKPGDHVDILAKIIADKREITSFALQNITVLAVGQRLVSTDNLKNTNNSPTSNNINSDETYSTVTLSVTPEQAETLMYLTGYPTQLVLRSPDDDAIVSIPPQSGAEILSKLGQARAQQDSNIEIIRNNP